MGNTCYIVGASGEDFDSFNVEKGDLIIASDGGYKYLTEKGYTPHILIGDFDSFEYFDVKKLPKHIQIIQHPVIKDDTDTMLCIKHGISKGYKRFVIFGGMGGRISHTYANVQSLAYLADIGHFGRLSSTKCDIYVIKNERLVFDSSSKGSISVFAYGDTANGVCEKGLKYTLDNAVLTNKFPLGVSNSFIGKESEISVKNGMLLIIVEK